MSTISSFSLRQERIHGHCMAATGQLLKEKLLENIFGFAPVSMEYPN